MFLLAVAGLSVPSITSMPVTANNRIDLSIHLQVTGIPGKYE